MPGDGAKPRTKKVPKTSAADRELVEIEQLAARCQDEAPEPGSNPLDTEDAEITAERASYGRARKFSELPISQRTLAGLGKGKWARMTDIQRAAIPHALAGRDVLGAAKTGSGKTLAFLIPVLERLYIERWGRLDGLGALIISPTRELALQIFEVLRIAGCAAAAACRRPHECGCCTRSPGPAQASFGVTSGSARRVCIRLAGTGMICPLVWSSAARTRARRRSASAV